MPVPPIISHCLAVLYPPTSKKTDRVLCKGSPVIRSLETLLSLSPCNAQGIACTSVAVFLCQRAPIPLTLSDLVALLLFFLRGHVAVVVPPRAGGPRGTTEDASFKRCSDRRKQKPT